MGSLHSVLSDTVFSQDIRPSFAREESLSSLKTGLAPEVQSGGRVAIPQLSRDRRFAGKEDLLAEFDRMTARRGYHTRSEAFRDLIREKLLSDIVESNKPVVGTLTIV
jgi:hypothetical protein